MQCMFLQTRNKIFFLLSILQYFIKDVKENLKSLMVKSGRDPKVGRIAIPAGNEWSRAASLGFFD